MLPEGLQCPKSQRPITREKLLLVEGKDAFRFFKALLCHLDLLSEIEIRNFGGVNDLRVYLDTLKITSGFRRVRSLGIVRDAEDSETSAFQSVSGSLSSMGLNLPQKCNAITEGAPNVSIFILPDCENPGMLETLLYQGIDDVLTKSCVEEYFQCLQKNNCSLPANMHKARVHVFLSSKYPGLRIGEAAQKGLWDWNNTIFDSLKEFLRQI